MEIKCQLDATDDFYCRSYCLLNMFREPLCPSSGARGYYTSGCCLWYLVLWFSSCRYGVELRVVCPVCGQQQSGSLFCFVSLKEQININCFILSILHIPRLSCLSLYHSKIITRIHSRFTLTILRHEKKGRAI